MKNEMVELSPETRQIGVPAARRGAKALAATHAARTPVRPATHTRDEPVRPTSGQRTLSRPFPPVDGSAQAAERKASISALFAESRRTGKSLWLEKATGAALVLAAAIAIGASFVAAKNLFTGWAEFERFVERILF
jgi:hypothetical protein